MSLFESAELGHKLSKADFAEREEQLRERLLKAQYRLAEQPDFPVVILCSGVDGAGKGDTVNLLNEWMDPRLIQTNAMAAPTEEERSRPRMWRFWRALPPRGSIGVFFGSWYTMPVNEQVDGGADPALLARRVGEIQRFEQMLANEGALILKFWFHLSKAEQEKRLKDLEKDKRTAWQVGSREWENHGRYDEFRNVSEELVRATSTASSPWIIVESTDKRYRNATVAETLASALERKLETAAPAPVTPVAPLVGRATDDKTLLSSLQLDQKLEKPKYKERYADLQMRLAKLSRNPDFNQHKAVVAVFEGHDAAGKGGAIRRVVRAVDARHYRVIRVGAPTDEEKFQPYLWRFWRHIPQTGHFTIFDRSWYGRVLVERIEGFCSDSDWLRAYDEINDFEAELSDSGILVAKFWIAIDKDEQLRRFRDREQSPLKRYKLTDEDWRNRHKWDEYQQAIDDMLTRTGTRLAPWTLIEGNNKYYARIKVMETLCKRIEESMV